MTEHTTGPADFDVEPDPPESMTATSYDSLWGWHIKVRKISDVPIPVRGGVSGVQMAAFVVAFLTQVVVLGAIVMPISALLHITLPSWLILALLFGPPVLAGQRIAHVAPGGMLPGEWIMTMLWYIIDDPVHEAGRPLKKVRDETQPQWFVERTWIPYAQDSVTTTASEHRLRRAKPVPIAEFINRTVEANAARYAAEQNRQREELHDISYRRGTSVEHQATVTEFPDLIGFYTSSDEEFDLPELPPRRNLQ